MNNKHLGVTARPQTLRNLVFKSPQIQNSPEIYETWHGVMTWHIYAMVIKFVQFGAILVQASYRPEHLTMKPLGSGREPVTLVGEMTSLPLLDLDFSLDTT
jgi:hypothetical protein